MSDRRQFITERLDEEREYYNETKKKAEEH
jgi:hypothetical protein